MQFRKIAAVAGSALMTGMTLAGAVMAATTVGTIADLAKPSDSVANYPLIVVGKTAATADVAGAINIALKLAASSKATTTVAEVTAAIDGVEKDTIGLNNTLGQTSSDFPASGVLKTAHFSGLKDGTFSHRSTDYDYREQVDISGVKMVHNDISKVNLTEKMRVQDGDIKYEFVFEKDVWINNTATTLGTISNPEYTNPIKVKVLGNEFTIVGISSTSLKMLVGQTGTAKKQGTTVTGVTSGDYTVYVTSGANNDWASFEVKKADGTLVESVSGISEGNSKDASVSGLTIKVTDVRVAGTDPSTAIFEADIVVGPTGSTEKTYDNSADVESTGTANEAFPGTTRWGIQYSPGSGAADQKITSGSKIQVVYKPKEAEYYKAGEKVSLPNNYGELEFTGFNTDKFAKVTIEGLSSSITAYNYSADTQSISGLTGIKISTDVGGSIVSKAGNSFSTAYFLLNKSLSATQYPVLVGFYDVAKQKTLVNGTLRQPTPGSTTNYKNTDEYSSAVLNTTSTDTLQYDFKLNYGNAGDQDFWLNITINPANSLLFTTVRAGKAGQETVQMQFTNSSVWKTDAAPTIRLGNTTTSAEDEEVKIDGEGSTANVGKKTQDELVDDSGLLVLNPSSNGASEKVVLKVPFKDLKVKAYFGKPGTVTTGATQDKVVPITADVARLDSEVSSADKTGSNLILVGGPCVNTLVADLATAAKFPYACDTWPGENLAIVKVIEDAFATGKAAVVVAGTRAADTDLAARAIQAGKLDAQTGTSVTIKGESIETMTVS